MSMSTATSYKCDICSYKVVYVEGDEPKDAEGKPTWKYIHYSLGNDDFAEIDICPTCAKNMSGNKVIGRISDIVRKSIESVQS